MRHSNEVFTGKTGTGTSAEVSRRQLGILAFAQPVIAKLELTYGTSITIQLQGKQIMKSTYETIAEKTFTTGTPKYIHQLLNPEKRFEKYRLNISANTGCTLTAYLGHGHVEN